MLKQTSLVNCCITLLIYYLIISCYYGLCWLLQYKLSFIYTYWIIQGYSHNDFIKRFIFPDNIQSGSKYMVYMEKSANYCIYFIDLSFLKQFLEFVSAYLSQRWSIWLFYEHKEFSCIYFLRTIWGRIDCLCARFCMLFPKLQNLYYFWLILL